jgi:hypothetical protein
MYLVEKVLVGVVRQLQNAEGKGAEGSENGFDLRGHLNIGGLRRWVEIQRLGRYV